MVLNCFRGPHVSPPMLSVRRAPLILALRVWHTQFRLEMREVTGGI